MVRDSQPAQDQPRGLLQDHNGLFYYSDTGSDKYDYNNYFYDMAARFLAGKGDDLVKIDYNVLSVAAMTLALIMIVEVIRHKLDHAAHHRPFFQAVLENIYAECE